MATRAAVVRMLTITIHIHMPTLCIGMFILSRACAHGFCSLLPAEAAKVGIAEDVLATMIAHSKTLNKSRKKRKSPEDLATPAAIAGWRVRPLLLACAVLLL